MAPYKELYEDMQKNRQQLEYIFLHLGFHLPV